MTMTTGTAWGKVYFIGAGPGDPDLITVRGRALIEALPGLPLRRFARAAGRRGLCAEGAVVRNTASLNLDVIVALMAEAAAEGRDVARVHSGDPSLFGAIAEQMRRLDVLGIGYEVVPGVSSFQAAAAAMNLELTPAGKNQTVILTRAAGRTGVPDGEDLAALARHRTGMVLFLSAAQMPEVVAALLPHYGPDAPVAVAYRVNWPDQTLFRCTLATVAQRMADAQITRTALIFVGPMLDDTPPTESHLYDKNFSHLFRKAPRLEGFTESTKRKDRENN